MGCDDFIVGNNKLYNLHFFSLLSDSYIIVSNIFLSVSYPNALNNINNGTLISNPRIRTLKVFSSLVFVSPFILFLMYDT